MYDWFATMNRAFSNHTPQKLRMWLSLEDNFDRTAKIPGIVSRFRRQLEITAMDEPTARLWDSSAPPTTRLPIATRS